MDAEGSVPSAVARAIADAADGRRAVARERLLGYLTGRPDDLHARRLLADLYRQDGHADEAGRWGYLEPGAANDDERRLYERAAEASLAPHWKYSQLRKGLHWTTAVEDAPEEVARVLRHLDALAEQERADWRRASTPFPTRWMRALIAAARRG